MVVFLNSKDFAFIIFVIFAYVEQKLRFAYLVFFSQCRPSRTTAGGKSSDSKKGAPAPSCEVPCEEFHWKARRPKAGTSTTRHTDLFKLLLSTG